MIGGLMPRPCPGDTRYAALLAIMVAVELIAPRPVLFLDGDQDGTSPVDGIHAIEEAVRPVYRLYGKQDEFESIVYKGQGHVYTPEMWDKTLKWFDDHLGKSP